jgi:hypothetical protein
MSGDEPGLEVTLDLTEGRVAVTVQDAQSQSTAVLVRSTDTEVLTHVPIGSREAQHLAMVVDEMPVVLALGPGEYTRNSYQVSATVGSVSYQLVPSSDVSSVLTRDTERLGEFTRGESGISVSWHEGATVGPVDAAVGYALAAAFGTGAKSMPGLLFEAFINIVGGASPI